MKRRNLMATTAAIAALFSQSATAQVSLAQLKELVAVIENGDSDSFAAIDPTVEYLPNWKSTMVPATEIFPIFAGCKADDLETADNSHGMTLLRFRCSGRNLPDKCATGDLYLMLQSNAAVMQIAIAEKQMSFKENSDCKTPAPPPSPRAQRN